MTHRNARNALLVAAGLSLLLYVLPAWWTPARWLAWPLLLLSTLFHELGHGLSALLAGGGFERLQVYADGSGVATTLSNGSAGMRAVIAAGGPLGPPLAAMALFIAARHARGARLALIVLALFLALSLLLWLRNPFGFAFVAVLTAVLALIAWGASAATAQIVVCFIAIQLSLSVFARGDYLFSARAQTAAGLMPSDTAQIAHAVGLPYWFLGGLLAAISLAVLVLGLRLFLAALHPRASDAGRG